MRIRTATEDDWAAIEPIFRQVVAAGRTYAYPESLTSDEARTLWIEQPPGRTVMAVDGAPNGTGGTGDTDVPETVVGTAKMGPNRPGRGSHVATASFMVDPAARSRGVGRALGDYVVGWARSQDFRGIQFNAVVETNDAAVRLWTSLGFRVIGTVPGAFDHPEHGFVGLHVMYLDLTG